MTNKELAQSIMCAIDDKTSSLEVKDYAEVLTEVRDAIDHCIETMIAE